MPGRVDKLKSCLYPEWDNLVEYLNFDSKIFSVIHSETSLTRLIPSPKPDQSKGSQSTQKHPFTGGIIVEAAQNSGCWWQFDRNLPERAAEAASSNFLPADVNDRKRIFFPSHANVGHTHTFCLLFNMIWIFRKACQALYNGADTVRRRREGQREVNELRGRQ